MANDKLKVLNVLAYAIQMETDGKRYYQEAAKTAINRLGIEMYEWLAGQEDKHRQAFEQIYIAMQRTTGWPGISFAEEKRRGIKTLFGEMLKASAKGQKGSSQEIEVIEKAKDMELRSRSYYESQASKASDADEKKFYLALVAEEQGHYITLVDYKEYLIDPASYFLKTEHHSLDGG